jgi:transposase
LGTLGTPTMVAQVQVPTEPCSACRRRDGTATRDNGVVTTTSSPVLIILPDRDRAELESLALARKAPLRSVQRACIILAAADGDSNAEIAREVGVYVNTVRTWRGRFAVDGMKGLADRPRSGRPPVFATTVVAGVKALACALPAEHDLPLSRWSCQDLADEAVARGITNRVSGSTVRRCLAADAIKPWLYRSPATRTSLPRRHACWTSTTVCGTAAESARTST